MEERKKKGDSKEEPSGCWTTGGTAARNQTTPGRSNAKQGGESRPKTKKMREWSERLPGWMEGHDLAKQNKRRAKYNISIMSGNFERKGVTV